MSLRSKASSKNRASIIKDDVDITLMDQIFGDESNIDGNSERLLLSHRTVQSILNINVDDYEDHVDLNIKHSSTNKSNFLTKSVKLFFKEDANGSAFTLSDIEKEKDIETQKKTHNDIAGKILSRWKSFKPDPVTENMSTIESKIQEFLEREFPMKEQNPKLGQLVNIGPKRENRSRYQPGDWIEVEGNDHRWRLDMITRVIKQAPEDWDWNDPNNIDKEPKWTYFYNAGEQRHIWEEDLRSPESGLKLIFGSRPWIWQQWALLKLEEKIRYQDGHQDDFMHLDVEKFAAELWEEWLEHEDNRDFKELFYDERIGEQGRFELVNHIQKPFHLISMIKEDKSEWDFTEDSQISIFTYLSTLGSGFTTCFFIAIIQIIVPTLLFLSATYDNCTCDAVASRQEYYARIMAVVVFVYYLVSVVPDTYANLFVVEGEYRSVYSRLLSIRKQVWNQGDDNIFQMLGYLFDIYMNTGYKVFLSILNIYVLTRTKETIEVILNALAFEFVADMDELIARSVWYDPDKRWITAGAINVVIQSNIRLKWLESREKFSQKYNIPINKLKEICPESSFLHDAKVSREDRYNFAFMTKREQLANLCYHVGKKTGNLNAVSEYHKRPVYFSQIAQLLRLCMNNRALFEYYLNYRTWSRWQKVLFLPTVPNLDEILEEEKDKYRVCDKYYTITHTHKKPIANFYPHEQHSDAKSKFFSHFLSVMSFGHLKNSLKLAFRSKKILSIIFRLFDGIFRMVVYLIHLILPIYLVFQLTQLLFYLFTKDNRCLALELFGPLTFGKSSIFCL